jgi:GTP-binding protein HflX
MAEVQRVLHDIGAGAVPQVLVYNKFDKLEDTQRPRALVDTLELDGGVRVPRVFVSALNGDGLERLREVIAQAVGGTLAERLNLQVNVSTSVSTDSAEGAPGEGPHGPQQQQMQSSS